MSDLEILAEEGGCIPTNVRPAIVLACRSAAGADLDLVRCLGLQGVPVIVVGDHDNPPSGYSRHCTEFICARHYTRLPERLLRVLRELRVRHAQALPVFPTSDPDVCVLSRLQPDLVGTVLGLSGPPDLLARLREPSRFAALADEVGLPACPVLPETGSAPDADACFGVHAWIDRTGQVQAMATTRERRAGPRRFGTGGLVACVTEPGLESEARAALARLRLRGLVVMRYRRDDRPGQDGQGGRVRLQAIHPRVDGHGLLLARAGLNLPWLAYRAACGQPVQVSPTWRAGARHLSARVDWRALDPDDLGPAVELTLDWVRDRLRAWRWSLKTAGG